MAQDTPSLDDKMSIDVSEYKRRGWHKTSKGKISLDNLIVEAICNGEIPDCISMITSSFEFSFDHERNWRSDYAWPAQGVLLEYEGLPWRKRGAKSGHTTPDGYAANIEKYNEAILQGWILIRVTGDQVASGLAMYWLKRALRDHTRKNAPIQKAGMSCVFDFEKGGTMPANAVAYRYNPVDDSITYFDANWEEIK